MSKEYIPKPVPNTNDFPAIASYILQEIQIISEVINTNVTTNFSITSVEPSKRVEGMIRYADGTNWDPGAGRGLYIYSRISAGASDAWMKL